MDPESEAREHLVRLIDGHEAYISFEKAIEGIPHGLRGIIPDKLPYSIWQLVEHIRLAQHDILEYSKDSNFSSPPWPEGYWPKGKSPGGEEAWNNSLKAIEDDREEMKSLVKSPLNSLFEPFQNGSGHTLFRQAMLIAEHNAYHTGHIVVVRRLLGIWS